MPRFTPENIDRQAVQAEASASEVLPACVPWGPAYNPEHQAAGKADVVEAALDRSERADAANCRRIHDLMSCTECPQLKASEREQCPVRARDTAARAQYEALGDENAELHRKLQTQSAKTGEICVQRMKLTAALELADAAVRESIRARDILTTHGKGNLDLQHYDQERWHNALTAYQDARKQTT